MRESSKSRTRWLIAAGVLVVLAQFWPVDRTNPPVGQAAMAMPDGEVGTILQNACMDCHSHETTWPWYARVAPGSWLMADHVADGRSELNFSTWAELAPDRQDHKLEELVEKVEGGEMPLRSYTLLHASARLTDAERQLLTDWARERRAALGVTEGG